MLCNDNFLPLYTSSRSPRRHGHFMHAPPILTFCAHFPTFRLPDHDQVCAVPSGKTSKLPVLDQVCAVPDLQAPRSGGRLPGSPILSRWYARSLPDHDQVCAVPEVILCDHDQLQACHRLTFVFERWSWALLRIDSSSQLQGGNPQICNCFVVRRLLHFWGLGFRPFCGWFWTLDKFRMRV